MECRILKGWKPWDSMRSSAVCRTLVRLVMVDLLGTVGSKVYGNCGLAGGVAFHVLNNNLAQQLGTTSKVLVHLWRASMRICLPSKSTHAPTCIFNDRRATRASQTHVQVFRQCKSYDCFRCLREMNIIEEQMTANANRHQPKTVILVHVQRNGAKPTALV